MSSEEKPRRRAPGGGRKPKNAAGPTVPLGVNKVAPDVAALVADAEQPTAYVETAIRYYAEHGPK